ncbi:MAG: hypothetical protein FWG71_09635 [Synergistaceae bacterium]|nr:hypothetical protein [Synergistaceae bacterium]
MKLPSIRMRSLYTRKKAMLKKAMLGLIGVLPVLFLPGAFPLAAREATPAYQAPAVSVSDDDALALLSLNLGGRDVAVATWSIMNPSEKQTLRDQAVRIVTMAQGAELDGLSSSPDVARALRWGTSSFLADAWEKKIVSETDLSESAMRSFHEANRQWYMDSGSIRYRKSVYPASQRNVASRVKNELQKAPLSRLSNSVTVDWTEYDSIPQPLSDALRLAPVDVVMGPLETPEGHVLYEVLERRGESLLPFEKCRPRVREDMVRAAVMERLKKLNSE